MMEIENTRKTMTADEIREALEKMEVTTARGRAEFNGREIKLGPNEYLMEDAARARVDGYVGMARELGARTKDHWPGVSDEELESVEFIREQLLGLAKRIFDTVIAKG